ERCSTASPHRHCWPGAGPRPAHRCRPGAPGPLPGRGPGGAAAGPRTWSFPSPALGSCRPYAPRHGWGTLGGGRPTMGRMLSAAAGLVLAISLGLGPGLAQAQPGAAGDDAAARWEPAGTSATTSFEITPRPAGEFQVEAI